MSSDAESIKFEEKIKIGKVVSDKLFLLSLDLAKQLPGVTKTEEGKANTFYVAKAFLITTSQLSGQIIAALSEGKLSLSIIGLKTLLELNINANYIFDHPDHKRDFNWSEKKCSDVFERTNDLGMLKNKLGGISIENRARAIGRLDLYKINYASLCDYAHLMLRQPSLNHNTTFKRLTIDALSHSLCDLVGVSDSIKNFFDLKWEQAVIDEVISFRNKFEARERETPPDTQRAYY